MEIIETIEGTGGLKAHIYQDQDPGSPREWDNLGRIATVRLSRHHLADEGEDYLPEDLAGWDAVEEYLVTERGAALILPLYLYDHSMLALSTRPWHGRAHYAEWDSGQIGFIYVTRKAILENYLAKNVTVALKKRALKVLESEIETFNRYIRGDVYGYEVVRTCPDCGQDDHADLDSCCGFYGIEEVKKAAMEALEAVEAASLKIEITEKKGA